MLGYSISGILCWIIEEPGNECRRQEQTRRAKSSCRAREEAGQLDSDQGSLSNFLSTFLDVANVFCCDGSKAQALFETENTSKETRKQDNPP